MAFEKMPSQHPHWVVLPSALEKMHWEVEEYFERTTFDDSRCWVALDSLPMPSWYLVQFWEVDMRYFVVMKGH